MGRKTPEMINTEFSHETICPVCKIDQHLRMELVRHLIDDHQWGDEQVATEMHYEVTSIAASLYKARRRINKKPHGQRRRTTVRVPHQGDSKYRTMVTRAISKEVFESAWEQAETWKQMTTELKVSAYELSILRDAYGYQLLKHQLVHPAVSVQTTTLAQDVARDVVERLGPLLRHTTELSFMLSDEDLDRLAELLLPPLVERIGQLDEYISRRVDSAIETALR